MFGGLREALGLRGGLQPMFGAGSMGNLPPGFSEVLFDVLNSLPADINARRQESCYCAPCATQGGRKYQLQMLSDENAKVRLQMQKCMQTCQEQAASFAFAADLPGMEAIKDKLTHFHNKREGQAMGYGAANARMQDLLLKVENVIVDIRRFDDLVSPNQEDLAVLMKSIQSYSAAMSQANEGIQTERQRNVILRQKLSESELVDNQAIERHKHVEKAFSTLSDEPIKHVNKAMHMFGCIGSTLELKMKEDAARKAEEVAARSRFDETDIGNLYGAPVESRAEAGSPMSSSGSTTSSAHEGSPTTTPLPAAASMSPSAEAGEKEPVEIKRD